MKTPLQISFHNLPHSQMIESAIHHAVARLESSCSQIVSCHVVVDQPHRHHREGNLFQVRIDLKVPGGELVTKREPNGNLTSSDLDTLIHETFEDMQQQLEAFEERRRGFVKTHESLPHGRVTKLFPEVDYGFLETLDGREVFFHRNSVLNGGFNRLNVGVEVSFVEEPGEKGPQASTVRVVGRHGHAL